MRSGPSSPFRSSPSLCAAAAQRRRGRRRDAVPANTRSQGRRDGHRRGTRRRTRPRRSTGRSHRATTTSSLPHNLHLLDADNVDVGSLSSVARTEDDVRHRATACARDATRYLHHPRPRQHEGHPDRHAERCRRPSAVHRSLAIASWRLDSLRRATERTASQTMQPRSTGAKQSADLRQIEHGPQHERRVTTFSTVETPCWARARPRHEAEGVDLEHGR